MNIFKTIIIVKQKSLNVRKLKYAVVCAEQLTPSCVFENVRDLGNFRNMSYYMKEG
jgi:hypothetical protein